MAECHRCQRALQSPQRHGVTVSRNFLQIRLGFSYSDRPQLHSGLFSGLFKKFDKTTGVIQTKVGRLLQSFTDAPFSGTLSLMARINVM